MRPYFSIFLLFVIVLLSACGNSNSSKVTADLILTNAVIHTMDKNKMTAEAIAIHADSILFVGSAKETKKFQGEQTNIIDVKQNTIIPGFIEGHGHFSGLGYSLMRLNFLKSKNWTEIVNQVKEKVKTVEPGVWIEGRGWHQEKWDRTPSKNVLGYPYHDLLSEISPNNPVLLRHASGHSVFANAKAMELAGISKETPNPIGGEIVRGTNGQAIGVFEERAMDALYSALKTYQESLSQEDLKKEWMQAIELAQEECLSKGLTSFQDAGSLFDEIQTYQSLAEAGNLRLRLWAMIRHSYEDTRALIKELNLPILQAGNGYFTCRAIKTQVDGALGAHGAWLLKPYEDKPNFVGQNTTPVEEVENMASLAMNSGLQLCVHAIGDRANREVINIFEQAFKKEPTKTNLRWRMEHAQHVNKADIPRFAPLGIIASMQGIHCTSDAPFVEKRLGKDRAEHEAYPWRSFLDLGTTIANGTDAPVEDVDPIASFYASVTRKRVDGMEFFPDQKMTRMEALKSYTLDNAYAGFEEELKGSLEVGKFADITILSNDLINCPEEEILSTKVLYTIVGGKIQYQASKK